MPLPPMLEPQMYLPPIRTTLKPSASPKPSPSRLSGIRKVTLFLDFTRSFTACPRRSNTSTVYEGRCRALNKTEEAHNIVLT